MHTMLGSTESMRMPENLGPDTMWKCVLISTFDTMSHMDLNECGLLTVTTYSGSSMRSFFVGGLAVSAASSSGRFAPEDGGWLVVSVDMVSGAGDSAAPRAGCAQKKERGGAATAGARK